MKVVSTRYEDFVCEDFERYAGWHRASFERPPYQYELLLDLLAQSFGDRPARLIQLSAANGALLALVRRRCPALELVGVDTVAELVADRDAVVLPADVTLEAVPLDEIAGRFGSEFDVAVHWMRLLHFDDWRSHLGAACATLRRGGVLLISSLFNDHDVGVTATVLDYGIPACGRGFALRYNTISMREASAFLHEQGMGDVSFRPIELPFDLPRQAEGLGTYTETLADGRRLQISAGLHMPWHLLTALR